MGTVPTHVSNQADIRRGRPRSVPRTDAPIASHRTHSVYQLTQGEDGQVYDTNGKTFSPEGYSLFKHGDERWARRFGYEVADLLMEAEAGLFERMRSNEVLVASFPYKYVPTAAALMVNHAVTRLNHALSGRGKPSVGTFHAFKYPWQASIEHHFANAGEEDRRYILDNIELSVDEDRLHDTHLVVVDDIRVTGASLDKFLQLLYRIKGLRSLTVVFLCEVEMAVAKADPAIEGRLNRHMVENLDDVAAIIATEEFQWNIRVTKFVLEEQDAKDFSAFVRGLKSGQLLTLYKSVILNDYHLEQKYRQRIRTVRSEVEARGLI